MSVPTSPSAHASPGGGPAPSISAVPFAAGHVSVGLASDAASAGDLSPMWTSPPYSVDAARSGRNRMRAASRAAAAQLPGAEEGTDAGQRLDAELLEMQTAAQGAAHEATEKLAAELKQEEAESKRRLQQFREQAAAEAAAAAHASAVQGLTDALKSNDLAELERAAAEARRVGVSPDEPMLKRVLQATETRRAGEGALQQAMQAKRLAPLREAVAAHEGGCAGSPVLQSARALIEQLAALHAELQAATAAAAAAAAPGVADGGAAAGAAAEKLRATLAQLEAIGVPPDEGEVAAAKAQLELVQKLAGASAAAAAAAAAAAVPTGGGTDAPAAPVPAAAAFAGVAPAANPAAAASGAAQTSEAALTREYAESKARVAQGEQLGKAVAASGGARPLKMVVVLVGQVSRVHYVVWEKAERLSDELRQLRGAGEQAAYAGCAEFARKLVTQGAMLVEKSPGMAYALAELALSVGEREPLAWQCVIDELRNRCCYTVPHYPELPPKGSSAQAIEAYRLSIGYVKRADGINLEKKETYYKRMSAYVLLHAALLQVSRAPKFPNPNSEALEMRPVANPLGAAACWAWLARLLNQRPRPITPDLLNAFLGPTAHLLGAAYPQQFAKLLKLMKDANDGYLKKIEQMVERLGPDAAEERAAQTLLKDKVDVLLGELRRGALEPPKEADMPAVPIPDDTSDARGDNDSW